MQNQKHISGRFGMVGALILLVLSLPNHAFPQERSIYKRGRKYIQERKWGKAISAYDELIKTYPKSLYTDDAIFWIGFSLEQKEGEESEAFTWFARVVKFHPQSPWADDAYIHQIFLAKRLIEKGETKYTQFLHEALKDERTSVRYQAALTLGEMRDPSVLPVLEEMARGENKEWAKQALDILESYSETLATVLDSTETTTKVRFTGSSRSSSIYRDKLHITMLNMTKERLYANGLYHILTKDQLDFYLSLDKDWDRKEWWRKYWATQDPTPTTPKNEAEEEFKRRVLFVWKAFTRNTDNDKEYYPPWDSRGEAFIKFGKPDRREEDEPGWEKWTYYPYKLNFVVSTTQSNANGNGIYLGTVSKYIYRNNLRRMSNKYLNKPQFLYVHPEYTNRKRIKSFDIFFESATRKGSEYTVRFMYKFPADNIRFANERKSLLGAYRYQWIVFNEDYHQIASNDAIREISYPENEKVTDKDIESKIEFDLTPGTYQLAIRIEGIRSNTIGIYRKKFTIQGK